MEGEGPFALVCAFKHRLFTQDAWQSPLDAVCPAHCTLQFCVGLGVPFLQGAVCCFLKQDFFFPKKALFLLESSSSLTLCFWGIPRAGVDSVCNIGCLILGPDSPYSPPPSLPGSSFPAFEPWHQREQDPGTREKGSKVSLLHHL